MWLNNPHNSPPWVATTFNSKDRKWCHREVQCLARLCTRTGLEPGSEAEAYRPWEASPVTQACGDKGGRWHRGWPRAMIHSAFKKPEWIPVSSHRKRGRHNVVYTDMEYYSAFGKERTSWKLYAKWRKLAQKDRCCMVLPMWGAQGRRVHRQESRPHGVGLGVAKGALFCTDGFSVWDGANFWN